MSVLTPTAAGPISFTVLGVRWTFKTVFVMMMMMMSLVRGDSAGDYCRCICICKWGHGSFKAIWWDWIAAGLVFVYISITQGPWLVYCGPTPQSRTHLALIYVGL